MKYSPWPRSGSYSFTTSLYARKSVEWSSYGQNGFITHIQTVLGHPCSKITQCERTPTR